MIQRATFLVRQGLRATTTTHALFSTDSRGFAGFYHIEVSNAANPKSTQLTVSGPDVDGILATMTVSLAVNGCSLVELHAAKNEDCSISSYRGSDQIKDTFLVVDRNTGKQFGDDELEPLATTLLESLKTPINTLSLQGSEGMLDQISENFSEQKFESVEDQITVLRGRGTS